LNICSSSSKEKSSSSVNSLPRDAAAASTQVKRTKLLIPNPQEKGECLPDSMLRNHYNNNKIACSGQIRARVGGGRLTPSSDEGVLILPLGSYRGWWVLVYNRGAGAVSRKVRRQVAK
jgi:hypothetical protein